MRSKSRQRWVMARGTSDTQAFGGVPALRLVLISFLSLYFELTLIRWIPTQVRLLAYFTNFVLIAALLGLGVGLLLAVRRMQLALYFPVALLALTTLILVLERQDIVLPIVTTGQFVWGNLRSLPATGSFGYLILVALFLLMVGVFLLLGQEVGRALRAFSPLAAYSLNISGSLLGVLGFALLNRLETPPTVWFACGAIGFALYLLLVSAGRRQLLLTLLPLLAVVGVLYADSLDHPAGVSTFWSPYYKVQTSPMVLAGRQVGYTIAVNKDALQFPLDLSGRYHRIPRIAAEEHQYNLPYSFIHPKRVLVLGAGTGNDVAAALRNAPGAAIDAVEIDPVVADLGRKLHPERPYDSPRVHLHVTDARSFLQQTSQKYDLIVFGKLDSHRVFSHMSSVRMDNYVYTLENLETVRRHLAPGGMVAVGFVVHEKWIADRLFTLLDRVFGHAPLVYQTNRLAFDTVFFIGDRPLSLPPGAPTISHKQFQQDVLRGNPLGTWHYSTLQGFLEPSSLSAHSTLLTDDWPYLYMRERTVTANYLIVLVLTVLVSVLLVWLTVPRIDFRSLENWNFLLLGAGFALQETKGITDIALLFGSTWITNIIVISAILLVILLANLVVSRWHDIPLRWAYLALFATLLFNYFVPLRGLLEYGFWLQVFASGVRVAGPLFFSGIIFARWFEGTKNTSSALGSNLMGAVVGGLSEYSSLALGLSDLYLLALLFYGLSFALSLRPSLRTQQLRRRVVSRGAP
jgi:SAM-dependent methyltransferase